MKLLVLMPCDEQHVYAATGIYKSLPKELKEKTFCVPMFMEYLIDSKIVGSWVNALFYALLGARNLYDAAKKTNEDLIIIGNVDKRIADKFDNIFNFQEIEESLPYKDNFIDKMKDICSTEVKLMDMLNHLYDADSSNLSLRDIKASATFLAQYMKTDAHIEKIKEQYNLMWNNLIDEMENKF